MPSTVELEPKSHIEEPTKAEHTPPAQPDEGKVEETVAAVEHQEVNQSVVVEDEAEKKRKQQEEEEKAQGIAIEKEREAKEAQEKKEREREEKIALREKKELILKELTDLTIRAIRHNHKSYNVWYHRRWAMLQMKRLSEAIHAGLEVKHSNDTLPDDVDWKRDLDLTTQFLKLDSRNCMHSSFHLISFSHSLPPFKSIVGAIGNSLHKKAKCQQSRSWNTLRPR